MKHILYTTFLFCILLIAPSLIISSCQRNEFVKYITEVTHYITEVPKIKQEGNLMFNPHYGKTYQFLRQKYKWEYQNNTSDTNNYNYRYIYPYTNKNNEIQYIKTSIKYVSSGKEGSDFNFYSGLLFNLSLAKHTEILAIYAGGYYNMDILEDLLPLESYHYISEESPQNGYSIKGYYVKSEDNIIPSLENFFQICKRHFSSKKNKLFWSGTCWSH